MLEAAKIVGVGDLAFVTTPGMTRSSRAPAPKGFGVERLGRVRTFLAVMLCALALIDVIGVIVVAFP